MPYCPECGKSVEPGVKFCRNCGASQTGTDSASPAAGTRTGPEPVPVQAAGVSGVPAKTIPKASVAPPGSTAALPGTGAAVSAELPEALTWQRKIPLITNPWLVLQCIALPLGIGVFLGCLLWLISGQADSFVLFLGIGGFLAILFLIIMLVLQLATGGGLSTDFFISHEGVAHKAGSTTKAIDRVATVGSLLGGSVTGAGAGVLAMSQEFNMLRWADVRYVSVFRSVRSVVFRSKYLISPVVMYCTEENFPVVLAMIKRYAPASTTRGL